MKSLLGCLGIAMWTVLVPAFVPAEPVRTVVTAEAGDGAREFCTDLARIWSNRYDPTPEHLAVRTLATPGARLEAVRRGRADFAVVDAESASASLADSPRLAAVAVLWPTVLHAVTRNPRVQELALPLAAETWLFQGAGIAERVLMDRSRKSAAQRALIHRMDETLLLDALEYAREPVILFGGPVPTRELTGAAGRDSALRVLPISGALLEEFKLAFPWLATAKLDPGTYPGLQRPTEMPAVYQVLVGRRDLPAATVRKVLSTVYGAGNALALFNPLFAQLDPRMNAVLAKLMAFHPSTAQRYNFTSSLP